MAKAATERRVRVTVNKVPQSQKSIKLVIQSQLYTLVMTTVTSRVTST